MKEQRSANKSYIEKMILNLLLNDPDENISNQFKPKKLLSYIKSLCTDKTGVTPMRSDGQITADKNPPSSINSVSRYSLWNHKTTSPIAPKPTP